MAYRCRSLSRPTFSVFKSAFTKPTVKPKSAPSFRTVTARSPLTTPGQAPLNPFSPIFVIFSILRILTVGSSVGCSSVSASSPLSGIFGPAHVVPWTRFYELQVVVSGTRSQCAAMRLQLEDSD
ncbi:hypothetical protein SO802_032562 [Lithocarpus litseifolius]|uniref:Uncharacterized protein n=1 Tax=Lithocarpus litseifolius TaxID=425828 RepID=A0AAW2BB60_9ROSI